MYRTIIKYDNGSNIQTKPVNNLWMYDYTIVF